MAETPPPIAAATDRWRPRWISQAAHLLLLVAAAAAVFAAGRVHEGHAGIFLILAGVALLLFPPQARVDWRIVGFGAALLVACSMAMLPQSWLPQPEWRERLASTAFPPVGPVTPSPRETMYWAGMVAVGICIALFGLAHPLGTRALSVFALAAVVICGSYAGLAIFARQTGWEYPLDYDPAVFGFFRNRNHTAAFLVTGCMLALGVLAVAVRACSWSAAIATTACLGSGLACLIFFSASRSGIVFLIAGALLWFAGLGKAHWSKPLLISFGAIFVAGFLLFLASKSAVLDRMVQFTGLIRDRASESLQPGSPATDAEVPLDGRIAIFRDTLRLIKESPVTGTGLGTFPHTFRFYKKESLGFPPVIHPESDWLMLAAEAGVPALLVLFAGVGWLFRRVWRLRDHPAWPLRWGILSAAIAAFLHGLVDAPAHRTALGWWILILFVVGLQTSPRVRLRPSRLQHLLFLAGGFGALAFGLQLIRAEWFGGRSSPPFAAYAAEAEIIGLRVEGKAHEAVTVAREAIRNSPMNDRLYFQLGVVLLELLRSESEADAVLATQRVLDPNTPEIAVEQGFLWIDIDPAKTATLWFEAIERQARIDATRGDPKGAISLYRDLIRQAESKPELQRRLLDAPGRGGDFTLVWLQAAASALVAAELPRLAADTRFLTGLDESGRRSFLRVWYDRGAKPALFEFIEKHPEWSAAAWPAQIRQMVDAGKFEQAVKGVAVRHNISLELPLADGAKSGGLDETNPAAAFAAYWQRGNLVTARRILDEARRGRGSNDREVWRLSAALAAHDGQWQAAWLYIESWLRQSGLDATR